MLIRNNRWNDDSQCDEPFPILFSSIERTLRNIGKQKYDSSPNSVQEIRERFADPTILRDLGTSLHREHGQLYNYIHEEESFSY